MKITGKNISMVRGDSETLVVSVKDSSGIVINLMDGDTVYLTVKESIHTVEKLIQKVVTTFTEGKAVIEIVPEDTRNLKFGTYIYDIQLIRFDGKVTTIITPSVFTIEGEVTYE